MYGRGGPEQESGGLMQKYKTLALSRPAPHSRCHKQPKAATVVWPLSAACGSGRRVRF